MRAVEFCIPSLAFIFGLLSDNSHRAARARLGAGCRDFRQSIVFSACCARSHRVALWLEIDFLC